MGLGLVVPQVRASGAQRTAQVWNLPDLLDRNYCARLQEDRYPSSARFPLYFVASLWEPNVRKKGPIIIKGPLRGYWANKEVYIKFLSYTYRTQTNLSEYGSP